MFQERVVENQTPKIYLSLSVCICLCVPLALIATLKCQNVRRAVDVSWSSCCPCLWRFIFDSNQAFVGLFVHWIVSPCDVYALWVSSAQPGRLYINIKVNGLESGNLINNRYSLYPTSTSSHVYTRIIGLYLCL